MRNQPAFAGPVRESSSRPDDDDDDDEDDDEDVTRRSPPARFDFGLGGRQDDKSQTDNSPASG